MDRGIDKKACNVYVYRASPKSLRMDVDRVLCAEEFKSFGTDDVIYIKVNANYDREWPGCNTSRWFLDALLYCLKKRGYRKLTAVEGDLKLQPAIRTVECIGLKEILDKYYVPFLPIEKAKRDEFEVPLLLHDANLINASVLHTHTFAVISCATKNLFGLLPIYREKYHNVLSQKLIGLKEHLGDINCNMFSIIDGTVGLDGGSMRMGNPKRTDLLLAGMDTLALDKVAAEVMGFSVEKVPLLKQAIEAGALDTGSIIVKGDYRLGLPAYKFIYKDSSIAQLDLYLRRNALTRGLFNYNSFFDRLAQRARRRYTAAAARKKKGLFANGDWKEYQDYFKVSA